MSFLEIGIGILIFGMVSYITSLASMAVIDPHKPSNVFMVRNGVFIGSVCSCICVILGASVIVLTIDPSHLAFVMGSMAIPVAGLALMVYLYTANRLWDMSPHPYGTSQKLC